MKKTRPLPAPAGRALSVAFPAGTRASSHMDAPLITLDPSANTTDVYAFVTRENSVKYLNLALGVYPHEEPGVGHEPRHLANAREVLGPVRGREAQILVKAMADVVAVEQGRMDAARVKLRLDKVRDRRLPRAREAGEPEDRRLLMLERSMRIAIN